MKKSAELVSFLKDCIFAIEKAEKIGIEISDDVISKIDEKIKQIGVVKGFIRIQTLHGEKIMAEPDSVTVNIGINDGKIYAVKDYVNKHGSGLIDAKKTIEQFFEMKGYSFKK